MTNQSLLSKEQYEKENEQLFAEWKKIKQSNDVFVSDGIACYEEYSASKVRLLFVLKEANGGDGDWDLCKDIMLDNKRSQTWNNIIRWSKGLLHQGSKLPFSEVDDVSDRSILRKIGVMNIKKIAGGSSTKNSTLYSNKNASKPENIDLLKKQIELCNPNTIVCVVKWWFYKKVINKNLEWEKTSNGVWYAIHDGRIVMLFNHPQAYKSKEKQYNKLIDAYIEIKEKNRIEL